MSEPAVALPDWLAAAIEAEPASIALSDEKPSKLAQLEGIKAIEARLGEASMRVTEASLSFMDIDLEDLEGSKKRFIEQHGEVEGRARYNVALANWQSAKTAPVGLKHALAVAVGSMKIRNAQPSGPTHLNMTFVQMTAPPSEHKILDALVMGVEE